MNKDINLLYEQYKSLGNPETFDEFVQLKDQAGEDIFFEFMNNYVSDSLKKKENSQETPSNSSGLGENQPTPIYAQGNPQVTSVPISQDLDLNQAQVEAIQGVQNPASLNLELPQQSVNQNGLLESNGEVNTSSSVLEDSFNKNIQNGIGEVKDFVQDQITNPNNASLRVLPRKYENQFNNTATIPQEQVGNVSLPKKSRIDLATFDINGLQEIPIPTKSISDELGNVVAKINNDVVKAYKTPSGQTILQTGVGLIPEEVYLSLKDKEGKQRTPQSKDVYENINGVFVEQDYSEVPIDESLKSYKGYDYISSKDEYGNILSEKVIDTNLFLGLQAKGLGTLEFHEDGTPKFKINKDTAYILDSILLSDINEGIKYRNRLKNNAYISSVYEGAELEKNARENFISRYGQANYDKYGVLPPQVMDRLQYEERVQNYVSQGYTEQEAVQYANTYRERELQGVREENNFILNNIFSKLKSEDSQEKQAWSTFAENYPKEFRDFFNEYTEKFGDEAWDSRYLLNRFENPMRRASIKDEFINYLKTLQVYSQIELKNKTKQAKSDVRFGAENKNADLINQGYAKLNNLNMISKFIQGENTAIATLEDQTKPLFKQAYEKGIENAQLESSANRNEFLGTLELGAKKIGNFPVRVIGNLFQSATSFFTGNSDWSKYVNEDIEFGKNAFKLNKNAEELRTEVITYKDKQGNIYKLRDGNIYKVDKNGYEFYKPELDNNSFKSNLTEISRDKEWNFTSVTAQGAQLIAEVYLMNRLGTSSGKLMSKPFGSYAVRIAKELGTESRYYNILKSAYKGIRASENASPFGMAAYTFGGMTKRNNDLGYDGLESWFKGIFDSGMMYAANRFFPDARFFKDGDKVQKTAFNLLKNGDKKGALQTIKNFFIDASYYTKNSLPDIGGEMFQEMGLERMFQGVSDVVSGAFKQDKKIWEKAIDPNNFADISIETAVLTALSTGTIKGVQNLKTSPLASFEGMTDLERVILSTNMEGLPDALRFISSDASFAGLQGSKATRRLLEMQTAKKYLDQLPKDNTLTLSQTADVITNLQKLDNLKKEQEKATSESVKKQYQEQINSVEEAIAKTFEESKNNTIVDEQPQQTTQPEQTQETAQGQTTETNLQPEQGTVETEQGVSADLESQKADIERRRQEAKLPIEINGKNIGEDLSNYDDGEQSIKGQGYKEIRDDIVEKQSKGIISNEDKNIIQQEAQDLLNSGKSLKETSEIIYHKHGIKVSAGRWQLAENRLFEINAKYDAELKALENNKQNETTQNKPQQSNVGNTQTLEIIGDKANETAISEEEQEKINLERLYAYIEAKKQREREQQVQVSPSGEIENVQQNEVLTNNEVTTDAREIQELKNAIQEGESILNSGKNSQGKKLTEGQKESIKKSIDNAKRRLGVQQNEAFSVNEQPQTIEQPSETQNAPLVSESKSTNGKYTIRVEQNNGIGTAKILDNNGNEVKLTNKQKEKYVAEHFAKQAYPETVVEDGDKLNPSEFNQELVNTSNNPIELAQILDTESEFIPSDLLDAKENAIANVIGNKVSRISFIQFDDANNITFSIAKGYGLTKKGKTIDVIAQEAEVLIYGDWDSQNPRVTTEDVIDFMKKYNNGADTFFRQPNPTYRYAEAKFEKLTGIKATKNALDVLLGKKTATKIDFAKLQEEADLLSAEQAYNLEKEYNEWFNSLSLEDKNLELQKTYPYEQRTEEDTNQSQNESVSNRQSESSENVANQERDGATAEEVNQVSPTPQYEGAVTYTQFGEGQEGTIYYEDGVAKIKDKAGKVYSANSPLVKNLKDAKGNAIQLQKGNQRLTPITKQAFDALVAKLQKAFPRFAKVTYDFEAFKKQAEKFGKIDYKIVGEKSNFNKWSEGYNLYSKDKVSEVKTGEKVILKVYHGTTNEFYTFDSSIKGNIEGHLGKVNYFTSEFNDANQNYLSDGADITGRIDRRQDELEDTLRYDYQSNDEGLNFQEIIDDFNITDEEVNELYPNGKPDFIQAEEISRFLAEKELKGTDEKVLELYVKLNNPIVLGNGATWFDALEIDEVYLEEATQEIAEEYDITEEEAKSDYEWEIRDRAIEKQGDSNKIVEALEEALDYNGYDSSLASDILGDNYYESVVDLNRIEKDLRKAELYENYDGELASSQVIADFFKKLGFDGIILTDVSERFRNMGLVENTSHVHVFDEFNNQIKLADGRNVEYSDSSDIRYMQTPNGTIYGAKLPDGTIYLNPQFLNANTPIHEFSHLFEQLLPSRFKKGVELLKQTNLGKNLFEQLKQEGNYANLTDEQLWGEALNTHIGNFGENEVNNPKGKLKQLQDWIKDFFAKVGDVLGIKKLSSDTQLRMFTEGVVKDLLGGKPIVAENQVSPSEQVQYSFLTENDYDANGNIKPEVLAEIQAEREAIKAEAQANGTFMKAPNGKDTNLNEAQWIDVRTKRFKDWFGDWENDAKNASKVVDENGEPMVVYHGTGSEITEFDKKKAHDKEGRAAGVGLGKGKFYFAQAIEMAKSWAERSIERGQWAGKKIRGNQYGSGESPNVVSAFMNFKNPISNDEFYNRLEEKLKPFRNEYNRIPQNIRDRAISELDKELKKEGIDGVFNTDEAQVAAFHPNQIKSATANVGTYSASSNDIRYSINSTTPLSVKEQTDVINELVSNGEESAFAKLQETNWYKGLSEEQKQNINPTNIAETVINAVNANKRNLEQKVERRDAKIEKLQDKNKSELEKQKKYYVDKINDIKQKYKNALIELNVKNKTAVEKVRERLDLRRSAVNQIKQLLSNKEVGKNVTPSEVMSLVRMSELFFNARDLDKAFDKFITRFEKVFDKAHYRNKSAEEKFNDKLSKVNPLKADENASYRREKKSLKERMLTFKNKWFSNQGGIIKPFLEHRDRATGLANWEKRVAKNTVEKLTDEANKIGFNTEANWELFKNALQGDETAIAKLPETIKPYVMMMRSQIDGLSLELIKNDLVTKEQALAIEENLGKYITRGYSIFEGDATIEKVGKKFFRMIFKKENSIASRFDSEKWADAVTVFQQNVLNEIALDSSDKYAKYDTDEKKQSFARREGERRLLEYLSELESEYKKAGSGVGADTSVLERRKEIAEPIRRLLGEYIDPRMSFLLTVSRVSDLAYQRKFLSQVKEIGLGTFLFEEGDPNIPIEGYVKIASDTNSAYSPLNGLYTTKEFKDVFLGEPQKEKYEIEKLWLKLTGLVKVGKTVFSPLTQAVNFNANFGFLINNGLIMDVKQISPAFKAFSDTISNGRLDNYIVRELIEENILGQSLIFNEVEKDFGVNMERELIKSIRQTTVAKTAKEIVDIPFRLYKASDDFFKAFAYFSEADRYAKAYFGKKYEELTGDDRMKIRKIASEVVKNTMPNYDRVYRAANFPKEFTRNAVGNYLSFQAESIRTKINSIQYAIADLKNEKTRAVGAKRLAGIMTYNAIYGTVTTLVGKAAGMGMTGLLGFFDDEDEDEKRANFNLTVPEWARSVEKYYRREKDGTITWFAYGNANPYGIWYKTANAYFNGSSNTKGGLISVFDELLTPFLGTEMSLKWISNTFIAEKNDYGISLITPKDKLDYSIEKLSPSIVKLIKDNTDNRKENDFELVNILGIKKYNFNPTDQLRYRYNDYAALMSDLGSKKYTLEKQVESGKKKPEEVMDKWQDYDEKQKEYADEFRELAKAYISLGADPTFIQGKATKKFKYEINSISDWWDYITRPE